MSVLGGLFATPGYVLVILLALTATGLSALVAYQAYRGYRRNGSLQMLYLAVGFAFITTVPFFVDILFFAVAARVLGAQFASVVLPSTKYLMQIVGLGFVLYSLYGRRLDAPGPHQGSIEE